MKKKEEKKTEVKLQKVMHNLIIMDESGSMDRIKEQALNGANETIKTIRKAQEEMPNMLQKLTFVHTSIYLDYHLISLSLPNIAHFPKKENKIVKKLS